MPRANAIKAGVLGAALGGLFVSLKRIWKSASIDAATENENLVARQLAPELERHLRATRRTYNVAIFALEALPSRPLMRITQAEKVGVNLLVRLSNDLRCASLLAARGFPLQVGSITAGIFETAYTIAYIGRDETRAQKWIDHNDPTKPFKPVQTLVNDVLRAPPIKTAGHGANRQYKIYRQLCMAKHANPDLQKQHGQVKEEKCISVVVGPEKSDQAIREIWFALENSIGLLDLALRSFSHAFLDRKSRESIIGRLQEIDGERKLLRGLAKDRWGSRDPYPDRW